MKKKGIKIKRSRRNFYKRRKSTGRKVLETVILLAAAAGLVFVGYSVAPPLINFFTSQNVQSGESSAVWTPPQTSSAASSDDSGISSAATDTEQTSAEESSEPEPEVPLYTLLAPDGTLSSKDTLKNYLDSVKDSGYTSVTFDLKGVNGVLLYKTTLAAYKDSAFAVSGTLTAAEIASACRAAGLIPYAAISTLYDSTTPLVVENSGYKALEGWSWHDNTEEKGGKQWTNPYSDATKKHFSALSDELVKAGFESVILQNTIFPRFVNYDYSLLPTDLQKPERSDKLAEFAAACALKAADKPVYVQIDAAELLTMSTADYKRTAEIWRSKDKLGGCGVLITLDVSTLGKELALSQTTKLTVDKTIAKAVPQIYKKTAEITGDTDTAVGITGAQSLADADIKAVIKAFEDMGYTDIFIF